MRTLINADEFDVTLMDPIPVLKKPKGNRGGNKSTYIDIVAAFDIEATNIDSLQQAVMYIWQLQIGSCWTIIGRTWEQYFDLLIRMQEHLQATMVIYVHNLSYEFSFLKGLYGFDKDEVFATDSRKILKCTMFDKYEYRCSYFLSNMSLAEFLRKWNVEDQKQSGEEFDYSKRRYWDTVLTDQEMLYCINDVRGLVEAVTAEMTFNHDTLYTIPLTSTGYVRRDAKREMKHFNHRQLACMLPNANVYTLLREAFRGGNTHANRYYAGDIISKVRSKDFSSMYPSQMVLRMVPMYRFSFMGACSAETLRRLIFVQEKAVLMRIAFHDIHLTDIFTGCPYLSRDKCRNITNGVFDNGRILSADYLETTITDVDFRIVLGMYSWSGCNPYEVYYSRYRLLPEPLRDLVKHYYANKTGYKNVEGKENEYGQAKALLNSLYGFTAQDPVKESIEYIGDEFTITDYGIEELLAKNNRRAFTSYAWGVWITANARYQLQRVIDMVGNDFLYCDTDSVKYIGDHEEAFAEYNREARALAEQYGGVAIDKHGEAHYLGVLEDDGDYDRFCTLGAKKYAYEDKKGLHITIAGVSKRLGAIEMEKLENFKEGFTFRKAGGTEAIYNDSMDIDLEVDGHMLHITDNVYLHDGEYTLGLTAEYKRILQGLAEIKYSDHDMPGMYKVID